MMAQLGTATRPVAASTLAARLTTSTANPPRMVKLLEPTLPQGSLGNKAKQVGMNVATIAVATVVTAAGIGLGLLLWNAAKNRSPALQKVASSAAVQLDRFGAPRMTA